MTSHTETMKTYVLTVSRYFPTTHPRKGKPTYFVEKILSDKIHTIRANYDLWKKRIDKVNAGNAILSLRFWTGKPYNSKQQEFLQLTKDDGIGVQEIFFLNGEIWDPIIEGDDITEMREIAKNDGLNTDDFKAWFKGYDLNKSMAIIHFTKFRY